MTFIKKHGHTHPETKTYRAWKSMRRRCRYVWGHDGAGYSVRGIKVCARWNKFENFLADMGIAPIGYSLDRIDNNGNYTPKNCRWSTSHQQARNTGRVKLITYKGRTQCLHDWEVELGFSNHLLRARLIHGWPLEKAMTTKPRPWGR